ncbi:MAG: hypothetical protein IJU83_03440 [Clostridia bacterium]|nr:hypothetical protein [Clostridia bacterium]
MPCYKIADVVFRAECNFGYTADLCKNYLYTGEEKPEFTAVVTKEDILHERALGGAENFPDYYIESLALFRKLCDYLLENRQGIVFHSSAVAVDGKAYLFTAPSGTGKSTHARLWRQMLGDRVVMINDDKPIIRFIDGDFYVYGTPWNGKHRLDTNGRAKIAAVCNLTRGTENKIYTISPAEMLGVVFNQTIRPEELEKMDKLLFLIDKLLTSVGLYRLECNISREAAELSFKAMTGENPPAVRTQ